MTRCQSGKRNERTRVVAAAVAVFLALLACAIDRTAEAQVSPEEHAKHHPKKSGSEASGSSESGGMMGGGKGGGMMGGGMGGMMEKMGAPRPKDMYPRLMSLPDLPLEERAQVEADAHQRMIDGAVLMSGGFDRLTGAAPGNDFAEMQAATATIREGLAQFESGLAAHRAIREGESPRNVALQWFRREMNIASPVSVPSQTGLSGMSSFHLFVMALLVVFAVAVVWMYFFKMRRATELLQRLTATVPESSSGPAETSASDRSVGGAARVRAGRNDGNDTGDVSGGAEGDRACCEEVSGPCRDECDDDPDAGVLRGLTAPGKRKLCRLRVSRIFTETADVKTFRLVACHGGSIPFTYLPGQFLTLTLPVGEKPVRRSYTISSSPTQAYYCEITVKREESGTGSRYLHDVVSEGDTLEVQAPSGKFTFTGREAESVVLIAGGVGITPMMSITRALTDTGWPGDIHFVIACRDPEHLIFAEELRLLQRRHANLHIHVAMSRIEHDTDGYHAGRLSRERLAEWIPDIATRRIQLCGAPVMMESVMQMLADLQVPPEQIHTENFGSQQKPRAKSAAREQESGPSAAGPASTVVFTLSEKSAQALPDETVLETAERVGVEIDSSCRVGSCGVCAVKLLSGNVAMECDDGLEEGDRDAGLVLACQAVPQGDVQVEK